MTGWGGRASARMTLQSLVQLEDGRFYACSACGGSPHPVALPAPTLPIKGRVRSSLSQQSPDPLIRPRCGHLLPMGEGRRPLRPLRLQFRAKLHNRVDMLTQQVAARFISVAQVSVELLRGIRDVNLRIVHTIGIHADHDLAQMPLAA